MKLRATAVTAISNRRLLTSLIEAMFPLLSPGNTIPGYALDYSDLTEDKLNWRKNLFTETEFRNGLNDLQSRSSGVTIGSMSGFANAIQFPVSAAGGGGEYAYKTATVPIGTVVSMRIEVEMDDDLGPPISSGNGPGSDISIVLFGTATYSSQAVVTPLGGRRYSIKVENRAVNLAVTNYGVVRYAGNSTRTLRVTAYHLNYGPVALPYQALTDVSTEFMLAFPYHSLFQDGFGQQALYGLEQPLGLALDVRFGCVRGPELALASSITGVPVGGPALTQYPIASGLVVGRMYEVTVLVSNYTGTVDVGFTGGAAAFTSVPTSIRNRSSNGLLMFKAIATSTNQTFFTRDTNTANFSNISIREIYGNHAVQGTAGDRPLISARYNQLTNSAWTGATSPTGWIVPTGTVVPNGMIDGNVIYRQTAVGDRPYLSTLSTYPISGTGSITISIAIGTIYSGGIQIQGLLFVNTAASGLVFQWYVDGVAVPGTTLATSNTRVSVTATFSGASSTASLRYGAGSTNVATIDLDMSRPTFTIEGINMAGRYQRVGAAAGDYDYVGFPSGARGNGINTSMSIATLDLSASQRAIIGASVFKNTDNARGIILEHTGTAANQGSFNMEGPFGANQNNFRFALSGISSNGAPASSTVSGYSAPVVAFLQTMIDTSQVATVDAIRTKVNGIEGGSKSGNTGGTANLARDSHYFWRRGSVSGLGFDGMIYRAVCRGGDFDPYISTLIDAWTNERLRINT